MTQGAALLSLKVPVDNEKRIKREVLLGCKAEDYHHQGAYLNAMIGRFANRVGNAVLRYPHESLTEESKVVNLSKNHGDHCLHGGEIGFDKKEWTVLKKEKDHVSLKLFSENGDQGFPGNCETVVEYKLIDNEFQIEIKAEVSKPCPINITNHAYFNLDGKRSDVRDHFVFIDASHYLPIDKEGLPLPNSPFPVEGAMDLRTLSKLRDKKHDQLILGEGFDHCYLPNSYTKEVPSVAAIAVSSDELLKMEVWTNQQGLQFYTGNFIGGTPCRDGGVYEAYEALCFEAQSLPDSPNRPELGNPWVMPGHIYHHKTSYRFYNNLGPS